MKDTLGIDNLLIYQWQSFLAGDSYGFEKASRMLVERQNSGRHVLIVEANDIAHQQINNTHFKQ